MHDDSIDRESWVPTLPGARLVDLQEQAALEAVDRAIAEGEAVLAELRRKKSVRPAEGG